MAWWRNPINRQIAKVMGINFFGNFGSNIFSFGSGLYILHRTGSALGFGGALIIGPIVGLLTMPLLGYFVDHYDHRRILWWSQLCAIATLLLFGVALTKWPAAYYPELLILLVALKIADMALTTTLNASLVQIVPRSHLQQLNSLNQSATSLATIISPLLGALVYSLLPFAWFGLVEVAAELVAIILVGRTTFTTTATEQPVENLGQNLLGGLRYLKTQPVILLMVTMGALANCFFAALNVGLPYLMINIVKLTNTQYSWTETAFAVGMLITSLIVSRVVFKTHPAFLTIHALLGFGGVMISFILPGLMQWSRNTSLIFFIIINLLSGMLVVLVNTPQTTFMQQTIPEHLQGRVFALVTTLGQILMPAGTFIYSLLFNSQTPGYVFAVSGVLLIGLTVVDNRLMHRTLANFESLPKTSQSH